jgi:ABC-2 type transport system permease protein
VQAKEGAGRRPYGEVFDRGYRHYEGARAGRRHAVLSLLLYSAKRAIGIRKRWTAKIIPFSLYALAIVPAFIIVSIRSFLGDVAADFNYQFLYEMLSLILPLFAAAAAPELLCDDRRQRVLQLYFSRPLTRRDYLLAKLGALAVLMAGIAFVPALTLFLGNTFLADSPPRYLVDHAGDLGRIAAAGSLISLFYAAIALAVASYTDRKGVASGITIGVVLLGSGIAGALFQAVSGRWQDAIVLASPLTVPEGIVAWAFSTEPSADSLAAQAGLDPAWFVLSVAAVAAVCGVAMYRRYLREE